MATPYNLHQFKLQRFFFALSENIGTPQQLTSGGSIAATQNMLPATDISLDFMGQGTGILTRENTMDGYAGQMCSVPGTFGYTGSFNCEVHEEMAGEPLKPVAFPYFIKLLLCSGHQGFYSSDVDEFSVELSPSVGKIKNAVSLASPVNSTMYGPYAGTVHWCVTTDPTGVTTADQGWMEQAYDCTFIPTFNFEVGSILSVEFEMRGLLAGDPRKSLPTGAGYGTGEYADGVGCSPYVVKSMTVSIDDHEPVSLSSLSFTTGFEFSEVVDARSVNGIGASAVVLNSGTTVDFSFLSEDYYTDIGVTNIMNSLYSQRTLEIQVQIEGPSGTTELEFDFPNVQYASAALTNSSEMSQYDVSATVVRPPAEEELYYIKYKYTEPS